MSTYQPGLHILAELHCTNNSLLTDLTTYIIFIEKILQGYDLSILGHTKYQFPDAGFSLCINLSESHLSIHTWPEFNMATFDIFLSNFKRTNNKVVKEIFSKQIAYFDATVKNKHEIIR